MLVCTLASFCGPLIGDPTRKKYTQVPQLVIGIKNVLKPQNQI